MPRIIIHPDGRREVAEEPTQAPQIGAAPRLSDGTVIGADGLPMPTEAPTDPAPTDPAPTDPTQTEG